MITTIAAWIGAVSGVTSLVFLVVNECQKWRDRRRSLKNSCYLVCSELVANMQLLKQAAEGNNASTSKITAEHKPLLFGKEMLTLKPELYNRLMLSYWRISVSKKCGNNRDFFKESFDYISETVNEVFRVKNLAIPQSAR